MLLIVGIGAFIQGFMRLGQPAQAVEKSGWLYQQFGDQGLAWGMIALGIFAFVVGAVMFNRTWVRVIREKRKR